MLTGRRRWWRQLTKPVAVTASVTLTIGLITAAQPAAAQDRAATGERPAAAGAKVEQELVDEVASADTATFWVYLADQPDLAPAAQASTRAEQGRVVYQELTETAAASQAGLRELLDAAGAEYQPFWIANAVQVTGDADLLDRVAALPEVAEVTADRVYALPEPETAEENARVNSVEWNVDRVRAPQVWSDYESTGEGIVIGSIDTGAEYDHPALVNQYRGNLGGGEFDHHYHWWDPSQVCGSLSLVPCDNQDHGTHTIGTMVGDDGGDNQIGVAPDAQWIAAKGCEDRNCTQDALLSAGQFMLAPTDLHGENPDPAKRPHIINNSWGGGATNDPWYQPTVEAWVQAGIFPQFSSGNPGSACGAAGNPGNLPEAYSAGAFDINDDLYANSGRGPSAFGSDLIKPNISAPGVAVRSSVTGGGYGAFTGTSMASPHVAAAIGLMWSAAPALVRDIEATRAILDGTAEDTEDLSCGGTAENNNVWGQGKLDVLSALDQSPTGPAGDLTGTVTDADTGDPVPAATVAIVGEVEREHATGNDGGYAYVNLPVGAYSVTVSAFGYVEQTATVTVAEDEVTTRDFSLAAAASVTVSGQITDGSGHGWPMQAEVEVTDTPVSAATDPLTGEYSLELPAGGTYDLVVRSQYPGYADATVTVDASDNDLTRNFAMRVDQCLQAPGYEFTGSVAILGDYDDAVDGPLLAGFLRDRGIPSTLITWDDDLSQYDTVIVNVPDYMPVEEFLTAADAAGTGVVFLDSRAFRTGIRLLSDQVGNPASRGSEYGRGAPYLHYEVTEAHPVLAGFEVGDEVVFDETSSDKAYAWFSGYEGDGRAVIADTAVAGSGAVGGGIGVQQRASNRHVLLSMHGAYAHYNNPEYWHDDAVQVFLNALGWTADGEFECRPVDGGLVLGTAADLNTGDPVRLAEVAGADNPADAVTTAADGSYWLFSPVTGERELTASHERYAGDARTVDVVADSVTEADFSMPAGELSVEGGDLAATQRLGRTTERTLTITNTGSAPATVELGEQRGSFEPLDGSSMPAGAPDVSGNDDGVRQTHGHFSPDFAPPLDLSASTPAEQAPAAAPWQSVADHPEPIGDNTAVWVDGKVYSIGGHRGLTSWPDNHMFDPETGEWTKLANMPVGLTSLQAVAIDGLVYVVGGHDYLPSQATVYVYDPATDTWSQRADMPEGRSAMGAAEVDGQLYVVGGCPVGPSAPGNDRPCVASDNTWRYNPDTDQWQEAADYPELANWLGCAGLDGWLYCTGGVADDTASASTYAYDPASDSWTRRADLPYDNWGMAHGAANGQLVVSGGVTDDVSTITNQGAAYDPTTDTWAAIAPSNELTYRGGSACGFYKVGGLYTSSSFHNVADVERHPGFDDCEGTADVPWLAVDQDSTTIEPGDSVTVNITMDSGAAEQQQPGTHTSGLWFRHDTPYALDPVGVTLGATPPHNWGKIAGTITGETCDGAQAPIDGATVYLDGRRADVTLLTDQDGNYAYWLPVRNNPLTVVAAKDGYHLEIRREVIRPRQTVNGDFTLEAICTGTAGEHVPV